MNEPIQSHRDLLVWQRAMDIAGEVYLLSRSWPKEELYGLTSQVRRAAASIPANIAEGYGRQSTASYSQFLKIARGSLLEMETHLLLAERIGLAEWESSKNLLQQASELGKMLGALIRSISNKR